MLEKTGRWDEALALCLDILDRAAPAPITRLCPTTRAGTLLARRGEASAWEYLDQALADAERTGEPQSIVPVRLARGEACWLEGRSADAVGEAERADEADDTDDAWTYGAVAAWLRRTGSSRRPRGELAEPDQHQLNGHWEKAAQLWTDLGSSNCMNAAFMSYDAGPDGGRVAEALPAPARAAA
jgi:tetratricopeptide (TPR) repeat protein